MCLYIGPYSDTIHTQGSAKSGQGCLMLGSGSTRPYLKALGVKGLCSSKALKQVVFEILGQFVWPYKTPLTRGNCYA